jgi:hypothetical protein
VRYITVHPVGISSSGTRVDDDDDDDCH